MLEEQSNKKEIRPVEKLEEKQSLSQRRKWCETVAPQGNAEAQFQLGQMYREGHGGKQDLVKARQWFAKAAKQKHAGALFQLGQMYQRGEGGESNLKKVLECYTKAANLGNVESQFELGCLYLFERKFKDLMKGLYRWQQSATQGHIGAQYKLAQLDEFLKGIQS